MKILTLNEYNNLESECEQLEYVYNYCVFSGWRTKELEKLANSLGVVSATIRKRGKTYAEKYLNMSSEEIKLLTSEYTMEHNLSTKYIDLFRKIVVMEDRKEITELIESGNYSYDVMRQKLKLFVYSDYANLLDEEQNKLINDLKQKVIPYGYEEEKKKKELEKEKQMLDKKLKFVETTFKEIIELKLSRKEATKKYFNNCYALYDNDLEYVKVYFPELYKIYLNFKDNELKGELERYNYVLGEAKLIAGFIKNGIGFDNYFRDFDIVDFYELFDITIEELFKVSGDDSVVSYEERSLIRQFIKKNTEGAINLNNSRIEKIVTRKEEIDCQKDGKGFPILGTGFVIPEEDKRNMVQYLIDNNIPLTDKNYYALLTRYKNEVIDVRHNGYKGRVLKRKNS